MSVSGEKPELACVPSAIPATERHAHFQLARDLLTQWTEERSTLPDGYAFRFASTAYDTVFQFIANERKCCPFLTFEVTLAPQLGPIWLRMTGPEGTREVLDAELGLAGSCGCCLGVQYAP